MKPLTVPGRLEEAARRSRNPDFGQWFADLPQTVSEVAETWQLNVADPFQPGGQCSWSAPAMTRGGERLVLKIGWRHTEALQEADALRVWGGDGAVGLLADAQHGSSQVLLLEQCVPGVPMSWTTGEPDQDLVVAHLFKRLSRAPSAGHPFRPLTDVCDAWADEFARRLPYSQVEIDPGIARAGIALLRELPRTAPETVLLHGDLHAENILSSHREPWLAIDPKPCVGDPAFDALQHLGNSLSRISTDPVSLINRVAGLLDLDAGRLQLWSFARCVQETPNWPRLYDVALVIAP